MKCTTLSSVFIIPNCRNSYEWLSRSNTQINRWNLPCFIWTTLHHTTSWFQWPLCMTSTYIPYSTNNHLFENMKVIMLTYPLLMAFFNVKMKVSSRMLSKYCNANGRSVRNPRGSMLKTDEPNLVIFAW